MTTQRKIHHLLVDNGGTGETFRYLPIVQAFDLNKPVLVTEKVDGTTVQARQVNGKVEIWKRISRKNAIRRAGGDWHSTPESERYQLERVTPGNTKIGERMFILGCVEPYMNELARLPEGVWVYFEAMHPKIGRRYSDPPITPTIRVFDSSEDGSFRRFADTAELANSLGLPLVAWQEVVFGSLNELRRMLAEAPSRDDRLQDWSLEGWVLRQQVDGSEMVAKFRKSDLEKIVD